MRQDLPGAQTLREQADQQQVQIREPARPLTDDLRGEAAITVPGTAIPTSPQTLVTTVS